MREENKTTALDLSHNPKHAALFFDYVVPIVSGFSYSKDCGNIIDNHKHGEIVRITSILPPQIQIQIKKESFVYAEIDVFAKYLKIFKDATAEVRFDKKENTPDVDVGMKMWNSIFQHMKYFLSDNKINNYTLLYSESNNDDICTESYNSTSLELAQIPLIDTSQTEWKQIIEFREDKKSVRQLRNLRLFFHENYSGKEKNYVKDDLCKRYETYCDTVKDWGFETVTSSLKVLCSSKVIIPAVTATLAMVLFGQPVGALVTGGTGLTLEIGKLSLHIAREKQKLSVLQRDHPLAYIIDAKKKLE